ncbi:YkgJ family cysteine cluster protein [Streptomyces noursei]|uniref:YkgJ family cysteine cluster protein n=1 Tax=Streptomyces noursei TaxID=1971 RepID=UPI00344FC4A1
MPRRSDQDAALDALYAQVPNIACKGHCHTSCRPITMSDRERSRIRQNTGVTIPPVAQMHKEGRPTCPALTDENRCSVYALRPMICRIWNASEAIRCRFGCLPLNDASLLSKADTERLLGEAMNAGGTPHSWNINTSADVIQQGIELDEYLARSQEIPAALASGKVMDRYHDAFKWRREQHERGYA